MRSKYSKFAIPPLGKEELYAVQRSSRVMDMDCTASGSSSQSTLVKSVLAGVWSVNKKNDGSVALFALLPLLHLTKMSSSFAI